ASSGISTELTMGPWLATLGLTSVSRTSRTMTCVRGPSTYSCRLSPLCAFNVSLSWTPMYTSLGASAATSRSPPDLLRRVPQTLPKSAGTPNTATFSDDDWLVVVSIIEPEAAITPPAAATLGSCLLRAMTSAAWASLKNSESAVDAPWTYWAAGWRVKASSMPAICRS